MTSEEALYRLDALLGKCWTGAAVVSGDDFKALNMAIAALREQEKVVQIEQALIGKMRELARQLARNSHDIVTGVQGDWVSVKDRLPEREEDVLLLFETGIITGGFICASDTWCAYSDGEYYTDCSNNPTHWMPLPLPPKEEV